MDIHAPQFLVEHVEAKGFLVTPASLPTSVVPFVG